MTIQAIRRLSAACLALAALAAFSASTAIAAPAATTEAATDISGTKATLNARVTSREKLTLYAFEYGPSTKYGSYTEAGTIAAGNLSTLVSAQLVGLQPDTTYHFRIWATQSGGEAVHGEDMTLKTLPGLYVEGGGESGQPLFAATSYPKTVAAWDPAESPFTIFARSGTSITCDPFWLLGELPEASSSIKMYGTYAAAFDCRAFGEFVQVKMNGCYYQYNLGNTGEPYSGTVELGCENPGSGVELIWTSEQQPVCTVKIPPQVFGGTVDYEEAGEGGQSIVNVDTAATEVHYESSGPFCLAFNLKSGAPGAWFGGKFSFTS